MPNIYARRQAHHHLPAGNEIVWGRTFPDGRKPQIIKKAPGQERPWPASTLPDSDEVPFDGGAIVSVSKIAAGLKSGVGIDPDILSTAPGFHMSHLPKAVTTAPTMSPATTVAPTPDAAWLAACMQRTVAKHHPAFHVNGPVMATVRVRKVAKDPVYRKRPLNGREALTAKSCYLGKKGQLIFCFEPTSGFSVVEMAEIQSLEFNMDDAVEHLQDFKAFAVDILTQLKADPDMIPGTTTEEEMIKVMAINNDKSKEQHANWGSW